MAVEEDIVARADAWQRAIEARDPDLGWAVGYNSLALPIAAGVFEPWGLTLRPEIAAISMSGSSVLVAVNALALKRLHLPGGVEPTRSASPERVLASDEKQ